jgi:subtilisin family serine protease
MVQSEIMMKKRWVWFVLSLWLLVGCGGDGILSGHTYNLAWIHGERMRDFTGEGSVIGMRERMFDLTHPDFNNINILYNNSTEWNGQNTKRASHGTHVLGILAADGTLKGLAPKAEYVLTSSENLNFAFGEMEAAGVEIVNSSFIMEDYNGYEYIVDTVKDQALHGHGGDGIVHVFAAGNQGKRIEAGVTFPKAFGEYALIAGELDEGDLTLCSNYGKVVDIFVQVPVQTTTPGGGHASDRGSSCSVSIAVAVVAKVRQLRPDLNATTIMNLVCKSADHIGGVSYDHQDANGNMRSELYGCGRLNAEKLFEAAEAF